MHQSRVFGYVEGVEEVLGVWVQDVVGWNGGVGVEEGGMGCVGWRGDEVIAVAWV
jgi:hypothetical protein